MNNSLANQAIEIADKIDEVLSELSEALDLFDASKDASLFSFANKEYASRVHSHSESGLVASNQIAHIPRIHAVFLCAPLCYPPVVMVRRNGDASRRAGFLFDLSTNPIFAESPSLGREGINQSNRSHNP